MHRRHCGLQRQTLFLARLVDEGLAALADPHQRLVVFFLGDVVAIDRGFFERPPKNTCSPKWVTSPSASVFLKSRPGAPPVAPSNAPTWRPLWVTWNCFKARSIL